MFSETVGAKATGLTRDVEEEAEFRRRTASVQKKPRKLTLRSPSSALGNIGWD